MSELITMSGARNAGDDELGRVRVAHLTFASSASARQLVSNWHWAPGR